MTQLALDGLGPPPPTKETLGAALDRAQGAMQAADTEVNRLAFFMAQRAYFDACGYGAVGA